MSRVFLKIKVMSLAAEARIIRREERRWRGRGSNEAAAGVREGLHLHRVGPVRSEARAALLAYGYLRGRLYGVVERVGSVPPDWDRVAGMVSRFGPVKVGTDVLEAWSDAGAGTAS